MTLRRKRDSGFTLVELLVVIGIIALLIAILMPALSRARKQALQVSCGSNQRQVTYAALAYGNDWAEQLPPRWGYSRRINTGDLWAHLQTFVRLPIIGFDTATIWDWQTYTAPGYIGSNSYLAGLSFVMRDYLKNDFDILACPDGYFTKDDFVKKWSGCYGGNSSGWQYEYYGPSCCVGSGNCPTSYIFDSTLVCRRSGYLWLPHRAVSQLTADTISRCCPMPDGSPPLMTDMPGDIAKTASGSPELLVMADFNFFTSRGYNNCSTRSMSDCGVGANHNATSLRQLPVQNSNCLAAVTAPDFRDGNPSELPLGMNRARIDARVKWNPWQNWDYFKWSPYYAFQSF